MKFDIPEPCTEQWDAMERRGDRRFCESCQHSVLDLTGKSRRQAEALVSRTRGETVCVRLDVDASERPVFVPGPSRAPHYAGGLVLLAALGGCAGAPEDPIADVEQMEPCAIEPMEPVDTSTLTSALPPEPGTHAVPADLDSSDGRPSAEQRRLTERKQNGGVAAQPPPPHHNQRMGMMVRPPAGGTW